MMNRTKGKTKIHAMKGNMEGWFSQFAWEFGKPQKQGWVECGVADAIETIPIVEVTTEVIKEVKIPDGKTENVVEVVEVKTEAETETKTIDEMRAYLNQLHTDGQLAKPPHHLLGDEKLKKMYYENKK